MPYNSFPFYIFFALLLLVYNFCPIHRRWKLLLIFSCIFYFYAGIDKFIMVLSTSLVVFTTSCRMEHIYSKYEVEIEQKSITKKEQFVLLQSYKSRCKKVLAAALTIIVGILCCCKLSNMLFELLRAVGNERIQLKIIIPLGISYYTFSCIGYLLDIYWRKIRPEKNYFKFLLCMIYFPQIVQGPISRYNKLLPQFEKPKTLTYQRLCQGLQLMLWGYFKKMVIADRLSIFITDVFSDITKNGGLVILCAVIFSVFQLYTDFSGCMDIVTGASDILGVQLDKNFDHPFFSKSVAEFWRRWHITLGAWFKDYIYFPIATSPKTMSLTKKVKQRWGVQAGKAISTVIPLSAVWILTGIWHGTGWHYILWGCYFGTLIIFSTIFAEQYKKLSMQIMLNVNEQVLNNLRILRTFCLFMIGRLLTAPGSLENSIKAVIRICTSFNLWTLWDYSFYSHGLDRRNFIVAIISIMVLMFVERLQTKIKIREALSRKNIVFRWSIYYLGLFAVIILGIYGPGYDASSFVYANF